MMVRVTILQCVMLFSCCFATVATMKSPPPPLHNATTVAGHAAVLKCLLPVTDVIWLRPPDGLPVSLHTHHTADGRQGPAARLVVIGNSTAGQHHLLIRYAVFPDDVGRWTCVSLADSRLARSTYLNVLVSPPTLVPEVMPSVINKSVTQQATDDDDDDVYTISCVSHFAFPPVDLVWVKESGPSATYSVSPMRILQSRVGTMSSRLSLVLTSANAASLFTCVASHPTLVDAVGRQTVRFMLPHGASELVRAQAQQRRLGSDKAEVQSHRSVETAYLDEMDRVCLLTAVLLVAVCLIIAIVLHKYTSRCHFKAEPAQTVKSTDCSETSSMMNNQTATALESADGRHGNSDTDATHVRRQCRSSVHRQLMMLTTAAMLLISSLILCFPFYMKSVTTPTTHTDELQAVYAGSALWLDCTSLVQPLDSLVQVTWHRDGQLIYHQYLVSGHPVSYPPNTTDGFMFHARASSQAVGHVTVWPVAPSDGGVYSCHVIMTSGDDVTDVRRQKTTTVYVFTGAVVNYALLVCLSVALVSATSLIAIILRYTVTCQCARITKLNTDT